MNFNSFFTRMAAAGGSTYPVPPEEKINIDTFEKLAAHFPIQYDEEPKYIASQKTGQCYYDSVFNVLFFVEPFMHFFAKKAVQLYERMPEDLINATPKYKEACIEEYKATDQGMKEILSVFYRRYILIKLAQIGIGQQHLIDLGAILFTETDYLESKEKYGATISKAPRYQPTPTRFNRFRQFFTRKPKVVKTSINIAKDILAKKRGIQPYFVPYNEARFYSDLLSKEVIPKELLAAKEKWETALREGKEINKKTRKNYTKYRMFLVNKGLLTQEGHLDSANQNPYSSVQQKGYLQRSPSINTLAGPYAMSCILVGRHMGQKDASREALTRSFTDIRFKDSIVFIKSLDYPLEKFICALINVFNIADQTSSHAIAIGKCKGSYFIMDDNVGEALKIPEDKMRLFNGNNFSIVYRTFFYFYYFGDELIAQYNIMGEHRVDLVEKDKERPKNETYRQKVGHSDFIYSVPELPVSASVPLQISVEPPAAPSGGGRGRGRGAALGGRGGGYRRSTRKQRRRSTKSK